MSYFSRLALIFSLLPSTENWASREASCRQAEDKHRLSGRAGAAKSQRGGISAQLLLYAYDIQKAEELLDVVMVDDHHLCCSLELDRGFVFL